MSGPAGFTGPGRATKPGCPKLTQALCLRKTQQTKLLAGLADHLSEGSETQVMYHKPPSLSFSQKAQECAHPGMSEEEGRLADAG